MVDHIAAENTHIDLWANVEAKSNSAMWALRDHLLERLKFEGNQVTVVTVNNDDFGKSIKAALALVKQEHYQAVAGAKLLSSSEQTAIAKNECQSHDDLLSVEKTALSDFYGLDEVTPQLVEYDHNGQRRSEILKLEALLQSESDLAVESDIDIFARQAKFGMGIFLPDQPCHELGRFIRDRLGLKDLLNPDVRYTDADLASLGDICRQFRFDIKRYMGFNISANATNIWIFRLLCNQLGVKICSKRLHSASGMINVCWLDPDAWQQLQEIMQRRSAFLEQVIAPQPVFADRPLPITITQVGAIANCQFAMWTQVISVIAYLSDLMPTELSPWKPVREQLSLLFLAIRSVVTHHIPVPSS
jgi:hypothetical protein